MDKQDRERTDEDAAKDRAQGRPGSSAHDADVVRLLSRQLDEKTCKTTMTCAVIMVVSVLLHDGDHIRQALNWGYTIPMSLWVLNLTVYVLPVVSIFLVRLRRMSATAVCAVAGIFTSAAFLILHLCGSATGLWGVWNYSYFELIKGVTYQGTFYQGVDWISWVALFEVPVLCLPSSWVAWKRFLAVRRADA
ncbi:MAG: hypothetical protein PHI26_02935 [Atopobiaceae bacterium]|nr:hypothetical protein [Atopobiaceae bacterium]